MIGSAEARMRALRFSRDHPHPLAGTCFLSHPTGSFLSAGAARQRSAITIAFSCSLSILLPRSSTSALLYDNVLLVVV